MAVYVDDLNIIGMTDAISEIISQFKCEFEMKDLGETTFYLGLQVEHLVGSIFSTSEFVYSKATQTLLNECGSPTKFPDGGTVIGSKEG